MTNCDKQYLKIGYDLDTYNDFNEKIAVSLNVSKNINSSMLITGLSGSGKTTALMLWVARLIQQDTKMEMWVLDFKSEDSFSFIRECKKYFSYIDTIKGFDIFYKRFQARLNGNDDSRNKLLLVWDEYSSNLNYLQKKDRELVMEKLSEVILMGRSKMVFIALVSQKLFSEYLKGGARDSIGYVFIIGGTNAVTVDMMMKEFKDEILNKRFRVGEGVVMTQGAEIKFFKVPLIKNERKMKELWVKALS